MKTATLFRASLGIALVGLLAAVPATAQKGSFELGLGGGLTTLDDKIGGDTGWSLDFRLGYFVTDRLAIELQSAQASSIVEGSFEAHTLNAVYYFEAESAFVPYVLVGAGTADVQVDALFVAPTEDDGTAVRAAFGGRFELGRLGRSFTRVEVSALSEDSFDDDGTHIALTVLWGWNFGS